MSDKHMNGTPQVQHFANTALPHLVFEWSPIDHIVYMAEKGKRTGKAIAHQIPTPAVAAEIVTAVAIGYRLHAQEHGAPAPQAVTTPGG